MFNFLHTYNPESILINIGPIKIYWYGFFIVSGILLGMIVIFKLADKYKVSKETIIDSVFYLIIAGIIGARAYHVLLEPSYYFANPLSVFKVWEGGLAIHGAIIAGLITTWFFAKKYCLDLWQLFAIYVPGLALGQAIGRWGNYFNQELYGTPTSLPWGIPIEPINRVNNYFDMYFFHPTFLYESIGSLLIFAILIYLHSWILKKEKPNYKIIVYSYLFLYSILRFSLEFIRIDPTPEFIGLRWPQIISLIIIAIISTLFLKNYKTKNPLKNI
ncbi:MAG: Prolipoprotein diacylglyceryl transferase [Candidatus Falkowbacteria bacterium GW2011_GWC2_38_22]|uniref:Phosphatidylglycerol--prolipoprotein diacylglyceryl transferase n=1 Tax=Candidatus Falkowbacteria bacterium GW2011_GWE1_38_31 TaxID=1618638 RepID=A0A0G0MY24_9BACT|nr:MAG: Prolipoprotein diacylglyceryl transferase [Candidatus Falkowbacteria bacterium GW2011_GWF2_38_1205]KKQ60891.1 MAG: Prolipoprotein diacylglyceryl transferase [Candidatus Falkowbacteria bacterium GW2011_GWC2_38_22]KKQ63009.1 MAG: Prolipoprotein diacylglyceryl transferase [Candidatus Falkowbacteria bacterium GW2011_GWF1_38_22]KKQ65031.1 MAG: Prolipoprotein diacylglyceryl transferase [Candidatus Falkowbacteria bacterium GW2011_GWE2_38_254]KKQ69806.1 MAG: Prolipoprotein diacylglyceryl transf